MDLLSRNLYFASSSYSGDPGPAVPALNVKLLLPYNGANNSTTFISTSLNNLDITPNGDAKISTAQSKFGGSSGYFDGTGDYLTFPYRTDFNFSVGEFTIETWFNANTLSGILISKDTSGLNFDWCIQIVSATQLRCYSNSTTTNLTVTVPTMSTGTWYHVALVRRNISGTLTNTFYLNGVAYGSNTMSITNANQTKITIGCASWNSPNSFFNGYLDDTRISNIAVYSANFTPNTAQFPDPYIAPSTSVLLHFDGPNNSTTFTDSSPNNLPFTAYGAAKISTTQSKFGGSSGAFLSGSDYIDTPYNVGFDLVNISAFTIETFIYPTELKTFAGNQIIGAGGGSSSFNTSTGCHWYLEVTTTGKLAFYRGYVNVGSSFVSTGSISVNTWTHVAVSVSNNTVYLGINGTVETGTLNTVTRPSANPTLQMTSFPAWQNSAYTLRGYLDELRITKWAALYTSNYTVPTAPFT